MHIIDPLMRAVRARISIALLVPLLLGWCGCNRTEPIVVHESVPKTRLVDSSEKVRVPSEPKYELIVAIAQRPSGTWFFKVAATIESMQQLAPAWQEFLKTVEFDDQDQPRWQLPEGWSRGPDKVMRFATLFTGPDQTANEISISSLPPGQDLLDNVNRWRGQLGLGPTTHSQLDEDLATLENENLTVKIFAAKGPTLSTGMGGAPFAGRLPKGMPPSNEKSSEIPSEPPIDFSPPAGEGWEAGPTSSVIIARWTKKVGDQSVEISVLSMNPSDESWKMNVSAWASQLKLGEQPDVAALTEQTEVAGKPSRRIRLDATEGEGAGHSVIAVMIGGETGWLIKYAGNTELIDDQMDEFNSFLGSISNVK